MDFHAPDNHEVRDKSLFSHKFNGAGWRYEVAVAVGSGHIVSIVGPFKAGAANDLAIYRQVTKKFLVKGGKVLADRGYRGDETVLTNYDDGISHVEKAIRGRLLANHERVNGQLKKWACLNVKRFRHNAETHSDFLHAVAVMTQLRFTAKRGLFD